MIEVFNSNLTELAWPVALLFAWLAGECAYRWTGIPRISIYGIVGFLLANSQLGILSHDSHSAILLLANIAFGLILFEFAYRINLRWLSNNPWIGITGLSEAAFSFSTAYLIALWFNIPTLTALLLATLTMSTSPAGILRVINEQRSSGQVTERVLHLAAINCVLAVLAFKIIAGFWIFQNTGSFLQASASSLLVLVISIATGVLFGVVLPLVLRQLGSLTQDATVAFAFTVILLVALTHAAKLSPILATLSFGLMARHRRVALSRTQRNFGALGDLLTVMLFVYAASTLEWHKAIAGASLGLILVIARFATKISVTALFARVSGITVRKGVLTGLALTPISVFVILMLEQARYLGISFSNELTALTSIILLLEIIGPLLTQRALILARETPEKTGN